MRRIAQIDPLQMSFLDVLSCGLGASIILFLVFSVVRDQPVLAAVASTIEETTPEPVPVIKPYAKFEWLLKGQVENHWISLDFEVPNEKINEIIVCAERCQGQKNAIPPFSFLKQVSVPHRGDDIKLGTFFLTVSDEPGDLKRVSLEIFNPTATEITANLVPTLNPRVSKVGQIGVSELIQTSTQEGSPIDDPCSDNPKHCYKLEFKGN